jgi:hypothetical protein
VKNEIEGGFRSSGVDPFVLCVLVCVCANRKMFLKIKCPVICGGGAAGVLNNSLPHSPEHVPKNTSGGGGPLRCLVVRRPGSSLLAVTPPSCAARPRAS